VFQNSYAGWPPESGIPELCEQCEEIPVRLIKRKAKMEVERDEPQGILGWANGWH